MINSETNCYELTYKNAEKTNLWGDTTVSKSQKTQKRNIKDKIKLLNCSFCKLFKNVFVYVGVQRIKIRVDRISTSEMQILHTWLFKI